MSAPPPKATGLSLYANLLEPSNTASGATVSSAPVLYKQDGAGAEPASKKPIDPALRFQPIRRPQVKQKPKPTFPKSIPGALPPAPKPQAPADAPISNIPSARTQAPPAPAPKSKLADWAAMDDDDWRYAQGEKRQRGGRRKKKKRQDSRMETDWDELYDPTRPTNVDEYLHSDEKINEIREWKSLLYRHRHKRRGSDKSISDDEEARPSMNQHFAPPPSYSFAPPPPSPPRAAASIPDDKTGDDAYSRRLAMSQGQPAPPRPASPSSPVPPPPPPPQQTEAQETSSATISRAPVMYNRPPTNTSTSDDDDDDARPTLGLGASSSTSNTPQDPDAPRSKLPGQAGFAHRLMAKYGWTQGTGLGASESGIINPLRVQVEKRRKKADADGGGWAEPGNRARIIGGRRAPGSSESRFGPMSEVVVLRNMLENMPDLQSEIAAGLGQEIGEECGEKYGRVERLYIDPEDRQVFIKFTDQVSALRAVNELEGRIFNGNAIGAQFYDLDRFEKGIYR